MIDTTKDPTDHEAAIATRVGFQGRTMHVCEVTALDMRIAEKPASPFGLWVPLPPAQMGMGLFHHKSRPMPLTEGD